MGIAGRFGASVAPSVPIFLKIPCSILPSSFERESRVPVRMTAGGVAVALLLWGISRYTRGYVRVIVTPYERSPLIFTIRPLRLLLDARNS